MRSASSRSSGSSFETIPAAGRGRVSGLILSFEVEDVDAEFARAQEQGLAILARRSHAPTPTKRYFYLLQGMIYLQQDDGKVRKLTCGTPNANRARGGVSYYCVPSSNQRAT